jgi:hypothetical protein
MLTTMPTTEHTINDARRSEFAREIWANRRERGTDRSGEVPF